MIFDAVIHIQTVCHGLSVQNGKYLLVKHQIRVESLILLKPNMMSLYLAL